MALLILFVKAFIGALLFFTCSKYKYIEYEQIENGQIENGQIENEQILEIPPSYEIVPPPPPLPPPIFFNSTDESIEVNTLEEPPKYND